MDQPINDYLSLEPLYPSLSREELRIASENFDRYMHLMLRISKRIEEANRINKQEIWSDSF